MLRTTPIALMKTNSEVEPAEINGSGSPVGGIEPVNTSYCIINFHTKYSVLFAILDKILLKSCTYHFYLN